MFEIEARLTQPEAVVRVIFHEHLITLIPSNVSLRMRVQLLKAGYAADNLPRFSYPSIVGRPVLRAEEEALGKFGLACSCFITLLPRP